MALPDLIEIVPLDKPVRAEITVPGSKSITNRALILAALADGEVTLEGALWSEDTQIMVECLQELGFMVNVVPDPDEICNRTITVYGQGGKVPSGGTAENPLELFVGNAGTAARFLAAFVCLGKGVYRLHGVPRMHERPQAALFKALRELGYRVDSPDDKLPATIFGNPESRIQNPVRTCTVSIEESSQFASALLLCAKRGSWKVEVVGKNAEESPYVAMTSKMIEVFPHHGGKFQIEPDASSGSYFWAATKDASSGSYLWAATKVDFSGEKRLGAQIHWLGADENFSVRVSGLRHSGLQIDEAFFWVFVRLMRDSPFIQECATEDAFRELCSKWNDAVATKQEGVKHLSVSRRDDLGDSIMTAIVIAPLAVQPIRFKDLGRLRVQETERVVALRTELIKCGAKVVEEDDTLTVYPSKLHGAEIETCNDHRMAMCFAILGLKVPGIKIKNPACVKKTFPNFFQKLAALPPKGLGATILDAKTGRKLKEEELFAD
ncbi:MAG: 3-phosphoshikimate 1-carboxyvinyltransferase [Verrucomicrobiota bacterium]|jgi:3-phosphoshikimate 1-carboxyvinyltransferase